MLVEKIHTIGADPIKTVTRRLAEAAVAQAKTGAAIKAAEKRHDRLSGRIADLEGERGAVVDRRASGQREENDGSRLALIAVDIERLRNLRTSANQDWTAARLAHDSAVRELQSAQLMLAQDKAVMSALTIYLGELDAAMSTALGELDTVVARLGLNGIPVWGATRPLYLHLRKLAGMRGEL